MINIDEAKEISKKTELVDVQMLEVIQRFIFDKKGVVVEINRPTHDIQIQMMSIAFEAAAKYYCTL